MDFLKKYAFDSYADSQPIKDGEYIGYSAELGLCFTEFAQGKFTPEVTHFLITNDLTPYAEAGLNETLNELETQLEAYKAERISLRDHFAIAALNYEFNSSRGATAQQAAHFAYLIADEMMKARKARL